MIKVHQIGVPPEPELRVRLPASSTLRWGASELVGEVGFVLQFVWAGSTRVTLVGHPIIFRINDLAINLFV